MRQQASNPEVIFLRKEAAKQQVKAKDATLVDLASRIKYLRTRHGLAAQEVDNLAGITKSHTNRLEHHPSPFVAAATVAQVGKVFGATMDWLYLGAGSPPDVTVAEAAIEVARGKLETVRRAVQDLKRV